MRVSPPTTRGDRLRLATASLLFLALFTPTAAAAKAPCAKTYSRADFHRAAGRVYQRGDMHITRHESRVIRKLWRCQKTRRSKRIVRFHLRRYKATHRQRFYWRIQFARLPAWEHAWVTSTSACESGGDPRNHSPNGDHGLMQFKLATAWAAGFKVDPHLTSWHEQAVRAVWWKWKTSDEQWPVCGD